MAPPDNDREGDAQPGTDFYYSSVEVASDNFLSDSANEHFDEYKLACEAAVQANRIDIEGDPFESQATYQVETIYSPSSASATVRPEGGMPSERAATLEFIAITEHPINAYLFGDGINHRGAEKALLAARLFSNCGKFRVDLWGPYSRNEGTGVWGSELGRGLLVFIEQIEIIFFLRGMGIGTKVFNKALDWVDKKARRIGQPAETCSYFVVAPRALQEDVVREFGETNTDTGSYGDTEAKVQAYRNQLREKAIAFWRKQGFRRVGLSSYWAYATNPNHPSRQLTAEEDSRRDHIGPPSD